MARDIAAGRAYVELFLRDRALMRGLSQARNRLNSFARTAAVAGGALMAGGGAIAAPLALGVRKFTEFQDAMAAVGAKSQATDAQLESMTEQAKLLGRTTSFTAIEIANLQHILAQAGFDPSEIMDATTAIQNLGRATGTELAMAAEIAAATLRQFNLDTSETERVADVLTTTAMSSAQSLTDLGESMKYAAPIAAEAGISLEETAKAAGLLANLGIKGSMAGTALRQTILGFADASKKAKIEEVLGRSVDSIEDLGSTMVELGQKTASMPSLERLDFFRDIFGLRGMGGALGISKSLDAFLAMSGAIDDAGGSAASTAAKMDDTLGGTFRRIMSAVEGVQIAIGESLAPTLRGMEETFTGALAWSTEFVHNNMALIPILGKVAVGLFAVGAALIGLSIAAKAAALLLTVLLGTATALKLIVVFGPAILAIGLAIALAKDELIAFGSYLGGELIDLFGRLSDVGSAAWEGIQAAISQGDWASAAEIAMLGVEAAMAEAMVTLTQMWEDLKYAIAETLIGGVILGIEGIAELAKKFPGLFGVLGLAVNLGGDDWAKGVMTDKLDKHRQNRSDAMTAAEANAADASRRLGERSQQAVDDAAKPSESQVPSDGWEDMIAAMIANPLVAEESQSDDWEDMVARDRAAMSGDPLAGTYSEVDPAAEERQRWIDRFLEEDAEAQARQLERYGPPEVIDEDQMAQISGVTGTFSAAAAQSFALGAGQPIDRVAKAAETTVDRLTTLIDQTITQTSAIEAIGAFE